MRNQLIKSYQAGSSLLEALIAIVILATGLFGLSSLQIYSQKNINNAQFHTLATYFAYDMAERMRSNKGGVDSGGYDAILSTINEPSCTGGCGSSVIAQLDGYQWNQQIQSTVNLGGLPDGTGTVTKNGSVYTITVTWKEQGRSSAGGNVGDASFTLNVQI